MDPHLIGTLDPDPHRDFGLDPDREKTNEDQKHCFSHAFPFSFLVYRYTVCPRSKFSSHFTIFSPSPLYVSAQYHLRDVCPVASY
jgi:hypothetical protein